MDRTISAVEANRQFSRILRTVREGGSFVVTTHGRPVARITPTRSDRESALERRQLLLDRLQAEPVLDAGHWSRDELYER